MSNVEPVGGFESKRQHGKSKVESLPARAKPRGEIHPQDEARGPCCRAKLREAADSKTKMENRRMHATGLR